MHRPTRLRLTELNPHFSCVLCGGYFVDATTIIECLHSFCRACIVRYLETSRFCPICDVQVHKTKPLLSIRSDKTLQDVVYKLVPGLYQNEMKRRREFYGDHPEAALNCTSEERGEAANQRFIYTPDETISLSLEYGDGESDTRASCSADTTGAEEMDSQRRYLQCPAALTIKHLKKFITMKYGLPACYMVDITYSDDALNDSYTLMDIAYIYAWRRSGPMRFFYNFSERPVKRRKLFHPPTETESAEVKTQNVPSEEMPPPPIPPSPGESKEQLQLLTSAEKSESNRSMETTSSETPCVLPKNDEQHQPSSSEPLSTPSSSDVSPPLPPPTKSPSVSAISVSEASTTSSKLECTVTTSVTKITETKQPSSEKSLKTIISIPAKVLKIYESSMNVSQKKEEKKSLLRITQLTSKDSPVPIAAAAVIERKTSDIPAELPVKRADIADLSDNDDLGCQPDLVVDEQKMDSSDDGEGDDDDVALRKKIKAIAEKEDEAEATDDTEADSGRASDISSQARSSCDDDIGSPMSAVRTPDADRTVPVTSALSPLPPTFSPSVPVPAPTPAPPTTAVTTTTTTTTAVVENHRHSKPNGIAHIINNLHRYHEPKKDNIGALDLSPSYRQTGQERPPRPRPRPVANPPVLDNKHRLPTCLPAPTKQHTSCVPAPKHHSSTSHHSLPSPSSTSSSATTSVPSTPTYKLVPPSIPIYKKSDSYRNSHHRFKGSNLTVINPDPNSYRPKIVIKNLDPRPSNHSHHHHHHHHRV